METRVTDHKSQITNYRSMKHEQIVWNPAIQEWFCSRCGRTSDHVGKQDALVELDLYECHIPWVEMPGAGVETPTK